MPSRDSRCVALSGKLTSAGSTPSAGPSRTCQPPVVVLSSVSPLNSLTLPVTLTRSPRSTPAANADENTKIPSEAVWVPRSRCPPVPSVCTYAPLKPPVL